MTRNKVLGGVLALLGLPVMLALAEAVRYRVANRSDGSIVSSGVKREYLLFVPESYDPAKPTPLVISMHGGAMWPAAQQEMSQWNPVAERHGFIVAYPSGVVGDGPRHWDPGDESGKDVRFISDLIDKLSRFYNIDSTRIYADGLSNGGGMAFVLSCALADRIAAVGMVAAAHLTPWNWCADQRPVPMIAFHGTADQQTPYKGGKSWVAPNPFPDIQSWTSKWARRNQCAAGPAESVIASDVTRIEYSNCADSSSVVLYTIVGGGHTWPGGSGQPRWFVGPTSHNIHASSEMWAFFREHTLRERSLLRPSQAPVDLPDGAKMVGEMRDTSDYPAELDRPDFPR